VVSHLFLVCGFGMLVEGVVDEGLLSLSKAPELVEGS
jgi:hypothetical protein